jgi:hypothetical protein
MLTSPALADHSKGVTGSTTVHAPKQAVWDVISGMGHFDDKLQSVNGDEAIVEQKFKTLPMFGEISVTLKAKVKPTERIDFQMIKSDRIKSMTGAWSISPIDEKQTKLNLMMNVDPGLPVPRFLVNQFIAGRVRSRLKKVKMLAEKAESKRSRDPREVSQSQ